MAQPGWYPDPAGTPNTFRYWDGQSWSETTTTDPAAAPPGAAPPPPPPAAGPGGPTTPPPATPPGGVTPPPAAPTQLSPAQAGAGQPEPTQQMSYGDIPSHAGGQQPPGWGPYTPPGGDVGTGGTNKGLIIGVIVLAVVLIIGIGVGSFFAIRALTGDGSKDEPSAGDDTSETEDPSEDPSETDEPAGGACESGNPVAADPQSGKPRISGGGISIPTVDGYEVDLLQSPPFTFADEFTPQVATVEQTEQGGWISVYGVGGLSTDFGSPEEAADAVMACMADNETLYSYFEERNDLTNEEIDVDGAEEAWLLQSELTVDNPDLEVTGDRADVVVVDTGDGDEYGLYISVVPLGANDLYDQQDQITGQLQVD